MVVLVSQEDVLRVLRRVVDPELRVDVVSLGMIKDLRVEDGRVSFTFELTTPACPLREDLVRAVREAVESIPGVNGVDVRVSARVRQWAPPGKAPIPGVRNVFAIASGKGGVGKTTVAVNLAMALARMGAGVGILDADIYGPTVPRMVRVVRRPETRPDNKIVPAETELGVKVMSFGFMVPEDAPVIWRGPLVGKAVTEMLGSVVWGELDYLVVDLPPGTGDAALSLAQTIPLTGVVIVTTPQDAALKIAVKALNMFRSLKVEVLGVVENMSYFVCPNCGERVDIFGHGGARAACERLGVDFLGEVPLIPEIRKYGDFGRPIVMAEPDSHASRAFMEIASRIAGKISVLTMRKGEG